MIFTRVGCLLNGCCSGRASDSRIGLRLADHRGRSVRRYPVQLIEMAAAAALLAGCVLLLELGAPRGAIFGFALVGYGAVRLALDRLREPSPLSKASRGLALATFFACSVMVFAAGWLVSGT
jgi:prolipoprotein diacylglyceryltransferase